MRWKTLLLAVATGASGCQDLSAFAVAAGGGGGGNRLTGDDAFLYLRRDPTRAPPTDLGAVMGLIDREIAGDRGEVEDPAQIALLRKVAPARSAIDEGAFERLAAAPAARSGGRCGWDFDPGRLKDRHLIPGADKIPVRNQGGRGTCAAFTGVGAVEYAALRGDHGLATLDLSEQRFYFNSKPECAAPGACDAPYRQGSWYGIGFDRSLASARADLPREDDCPYQSFAGENDVYPQGPGCERGAAKLGEVGTWCGVDELIDVLNQGYAVPWASPLSANWESNDGLITKRDFTAAGETVHAGGHAYLIVGYRQLPEMPEEGGLCFVVKNSWGIGWGAGGYSCMTLEWMRAVQYRDGYGEFIDREHPYVRAVTLDGRGGDPAPAPEPEPAPKPAPEPEPAPEPLVFREARLHGPDETLYVVYAAESADGLLVRGEDEADAPLRLERDGDRLVFDGDVVGRRDGDALTLCAGEWAALCALRYRPDDGRLSVQFRDDALRAVKGWEVAPERGHWEAIAGGLELFRPRDVGDLGFLLNPETYVRFGGGAPLRLTLDPGDGPARFDLRLQGVTVGRLDLFDLGGTDVCGGRFAGVCEVVRGERPVVVPRNGRKWR